MRYWCLPRSAGPVEEAWGVQAAPARGGKVLIKTAERFCPHCRRLVIAQQERPEHPWEYSLKLGGVEWLMAWFVLVWEMHCWRCLFCGSPTIGKKRSRRNRAR
jgi:hypothetical protein